MPTKLHNKLLLFDLDGTLCDPRQIAKKEMLEALQALKQQAAVAIVSGTDVPKIVEQLFGETVSDERIFNTVDYIFGENGTVSRCADSSFFEGKQYSIQSYLGEKRYQMLVNYLLHYIADLDLPIKRGTFIELRTGVVNVSPIGRNCSKNERDEFNELDSSEGIRKKMVDALYDKFFSLNLTYTIGGQISLDIYPNGWDKRFCLKRLEDNHIHFQEIHFFGDKTNPGGNDYTLFHDNRVIGHSVQNPGDTLNILRSMGYALNQCELIEKIQDS